MKANPAIRFFTRALLVSAPVLIISLTYFLFDPFHVLHKIESFEEYYDWQPFELNREFMSTEMLLHNRSNHEYNSFILGNCISFVFHANEWKKYIGSENEVFHLPANSEGLYGIKQKLTFLDSEKFPIKNCLIVLDSTCFGYTKRRRNYLYSAHPKVSNESPFLFQLDMFKSYFSSFFCIQYLDYKVSGKVKDYMKQNFNLDKGEVKIETSTNEYFYFEYDTEILKDSVKYYERKRKNFYSRDTAQQFYLPLIAKEQRALLEQMKELLVRNKGNYKIILTPMYDQKKYNAADVALLTEIFGSEHLVDLSGINKLTQDPGYYYDADHLRPIMANRILKEIYQ